MTPGEYESFGNGKVLLFHCDCRNVLPQIVSDPLRVVLLTDPPYGCGLENHDKGGSRSDRAFTVSGDADQEIGSAIVRWAENLGMPAVVFADIMLPWPGKWRQHLVWDKGPAVGGGGDTGKLWKQTVEIIQIARTGVLNGKRDEGCLHFHVTPKDSELHPCQKPTKLLRYLIEKVSQPGDTIFDPFAGVFSVGVAAVQCGRHYVGCETRADYYEAGCRRVAAEFDRPLLGFED